MAQSLFVLIVVCWKRGLLRKVRFILRRGLRQAVGQHPSGHHTDQGLTQVAPHNMLVLQV